MRRMRDGDGWTVLHYGICAITLWIGAVFVAPYRIFESYRAFQYMASIADESVWGYFLLMVGAVSMVLTLRSMPYFVRCSGHALLAATHAVIAAFFFMGASFNNTGTGTYTIIAVLATLRLMRESYHAR